MIPNTKDRELTSSPIAASGKFGISSKDTAHIMGILRDTLYSDKVLAVLREYSANAWDAHRELDKVNLPIKVTIPTTMAPTLLIRDFGPGLSQNDVFQVYTQYGASTKRTSDKAVGMLGIGSKSGFAYSDSFTVTSWHGGMKRIYLAILDKTEEGLINLLHEEECSLEETGIEIQIAVKPNDALEFQSKAQKLFQHFDPRPVINVDLPPEPTEQTKLKNGIIFKDWDDDGNQWTAVMGCIPYRLDINQVRAENNGGVGVADHLFQVGGVVKFDIGEVQISASREELKYSETTKKAMVAKFAALVDEYVEHTFANLNNGTFSFWERRLRAQTIAAMKLSIPKEYKYITQASIEIKHKPKTFKFTVHGSNVNSIAVDSDSRVLLRNDKRELIGYHLGFHDYLVEKEDDTVTWDMVKAEIAEMLEKADISGLPILDISHQSWYVNTPPKKQYNSNKTKNKKHTVASFILNDKPTFSRPYSEAWTAVDRVPDDKDVFVIIDKFKVVGYNRIDPWAKSYPFSEIYHEDKNIIELLGGTMPPIYGYKTTEKKPVANKDCTGVLYSVWRDQFIKALLVGKQLKLYEYWLWVEEAASDVNKTTYDKISSSLGVRHPISKYLKKHLDAKRIFPSRKKQKVEYCYERIRARFFADQKPASKIALSQLLSGYPLLETVGLDTLWGKHADRWVEYVKLVDK
jgi:hypothetical protein